MQGKFDVNTPDEHLVREFVQNSSTEAFGCLYEKYAAEVYRVAYMRVGNKAWAEEIVSDTFVTLMRILENFRSDSKLKTFIIGVTINKVRQFWQKQQNEALSLNEDIVIVDEAVDDLDEYNENNKNLVKEIMQELEPPYNDVLRLRFLENKNIRQTAAELDLTEANVRVIQHRALKKAAKKVDNISKNVNGRS